MLITKHRMITHYNQHFMSDTQHHYYNELLIANTIVTIAFFHHQCTITIIASNSSGNCNTIPMDKLGGLQPLT